MFLPLSAGSLCRTVLVRSGVLCQEGCMTWFSGREKRNSRAESVYQTCGAGPYPWKAWGSGIIGMSLAGASTWEAWLCTDIIISSTILRWRGGPRVTSLDPGVPYSSHRGLWVRKERIIWVWKTAAAAACCVTELFQYSLRLAMMGPEAGAALTFQYVFPPFAVNLGKVDFTTGSTKLDHNDSISMSS
ncbi:hypothetical protein EDD17DRAFT_1898082 [Pisolithus thermaeus]|nr:hypothetical protein EDD17DRAFT_1898082 [Pisolithus thermaeus]